MSENIVLMKEARDALKGKWDIAVGAAAIYMLINAIVGRLHELSFVASLLISGPLLYGMSLFVLSIARNKQAKITQLFEGFNHYVKVFVTYLLVMIFIILWSLLLVVPGIIKAFSYSMTFYILIDEPNIKPSDAIKRSQKLMTGNKWKFFCLMFRFIGWIILSFVTLGIGFLWTLPYMQVAAAKFYDELIKGEKVAA